MFLRSARGDTLILFPLFATGVIVIDSQVIDTGGKFAATVDDIRSNLPLVPLTPVANFPPVSTTLIPVVHLDLRISQRIFEKIQNDLVLFSGAWGKMIHEKNLVTLSL